MLIPEDRLDEEPGILQRIREGRRVDHFETIRRAKDGRLLNVSVTISPIRDAEGKVIGASKIARDITGQLELLERLRGSEERFRITLSSIGDAVIATDREGKIGFMNAVAEELTGWTLADARSLSLPGVFKIVNEFTRQTVENPVVKVLQTGGIVGLANHTILIARDGTERPIDDSGAPIRNSRGEIDGVVLVFRDVSERRAAELASQRLAAIVQSSDDAIVGKDLSGIITNWNDGARRIFGYAEEEILGKSILTLIPPELHEEERHIIERLRRGERIDHFETVRMTKDGWFIQVALTVSPIRDAEGIVHRRLENRARHHRAQAGGERPGRRAEAAADLCHRPGAAGGGADRAAAKKRGGAGSLFLQPLARPAGPAAGGPELPADLPGGPRGRGRSGRARTFTKVDCLRPADGPHGP